MKKKDGKGLLIAFIISLLVIIGLVGFICYDKEIIFSKTEKNSKKENVSSKVAKDQDKAEHYFNSKNLVIESKKCLNCENGDYDYLLSSYDHIDEVKSYFSTNDNKTGMISIDIEEYNKKSGSNYSLSNTLLEYQFPKEIRNVIVSNIGQEELAPIVVFLMDDGTLNYVDIQKGLINNNLSTYKEINTVKNIVSLYQVSVCKGQYCSFSTILAQNSDGTFYDLSKFIY